MIEHTQRFIHNFWCGDLAEVMAVLGMLEGVLFDYTLESKPESALTGKTYRRAKTYHSDSRHFLVLTLDNENEESKLRLKLDKNIVSS